MQDDASSFMPRAAARLRRAALPEAPVPAEASRRGSRQNAPLRFERLWVGGDMSGCSLGQSIAAANQEGQDSFFARLQYDLSPLIRSKASLATLTLALARERQPAKPSSSDFPMRSGVLRLRCLCRSAAKRGQSSHAGMRVRTYRCDESVGAGVIEAREQ